MAGERQTMWNTLETIKKLQKKMIEIYQKIRIYLELFRTT